MSVQSPAPDAPRPKRKRRSLQDIQDRFNLQKRFWRDLRHGWPGALVSALLHAVLLLILSVIVYKILQPHPLMITMGWATVVEEPDKPEEKSPEPIKIPSLSFNSTPAMERPPEPVVGKEPVARPPLALADISDALNQRPHRTPENPNPESTDEQLRTALDKALRWIVIQQQPDGHWSLNGPYADAGTIETNSGATALALLALLGDGHTHKGGPYASNVDRGLQWLIRQQRPNGDLFDILEEGREPHFYSHAQGTIALCEALVLTGDESLREPARKAVQFLIDAQNPKLGGWKYRPLTETGIGDLSVTGWALMAMNTARMAGIEVPLETYRVADLFLNSVQENDVNGAMYKYRPDFPMEPAQRLSMTAEGLLCRQWLGWPSDHFDMKQGVDFLISEKNRPEWAAHRRNVYAWYYTAQSLHNLGGQRWEQWYTNVQHLILKNQMTAGPTVGSWHPHRPEGDFQERSRDAGRLYVTVMCVLILETPYRHKPLYAE